VISETSLPASHRAPAAPRHSISSRSQKKTQFVLEVQPCPEDVIIPPSAQHMYEKAKELVSKRQLQRAARLYDSALEIAPQFSKCVVQRASLEARLRTRISLLSRRGMVRYERSVTRQKNILRAGIRAAPRNAILWQCYADLEKRLGQNRRARTLFRAARRVDPMRSSVYSSWASLEVSLGRLQEARALLLTGLRRAPKETRLYYQMGVLEDRAGRGPVARKFFARGAKLEASAAAEKGEPGATAFCLEGRGILEYRCGNVKLARECFARATQQDPSNSRLWLCWGNLEERESRPTAARRCYRHGTTAFPSAPQLWQAWARLEEKCGDLRAALRVSASAMRACPTDIQLVRERGKLLLRRRDIELARRAFDSAIRLDRREAYSWQCRAVLEAQQLNYSGARELFESAARQCVPPHLARSSARALSALPPPQVFASMSSSLGLSKTQEHQMMLVTAADLNIPLVRGGARDDHAGTSVNSGESRSVAHVNAAKQRFEFGSLSDDVPNRTGLSKETLEKLPSERDARNARGERSQTVRSWCALVYAWAMFEWHCNNAGRARVLFQLSGESFESSAWIWLWFARFEDSQGEPERARHYFARSIRLDRTNPDAWRSWAELEQRAGRASVSREIMQQAMQLSIARQLQTRASLPNPLSRSYRDV